jgi:hypothetical protein
MSSSAWEEWERVVKRTARLAHAAGIFDGAGQIYGGHLTRLELEMVKASADAEPPPALVAFQNSIGELGTLERVAGRIWKWSAAGAEAEAVLRAILPWLDLGGANMDKALELLAGR